MESFRKAMRDSESAMEVGGVSYNNQLKRSLSGSEIPKCDERHDVRDDGIKSEPFCSSGNKTVNRETKASKNEYSGYGRDENLHSDTTLPKENDITGMYKDGFSSSAKNVQDGIVKNCNALGAKGNGVNKQSRGSLANISKDKSLHS